MTVGDSKAAMMIKHPALAPSPQPRPAPTVRALPVELAVQRGPFWMPIRGPNPTPIDTKDQHHLAERLHEVASQQLNNAEKQQDIARLQHLSADILEEKASKLDDVGNALEAK